MEFILRNIPALIGVSVFIVVIFCELIKKIDTKMRLKPVRPYIPAFLSIFLVGMLAYGGVIDSKLIAYYWLLVTGCSVFFYDAILQKIKDFNRRKTENKTNGN